MEGKTTQGTTATVGGGTSTADLTSKGVNVAYSFDMWLWCLFSIILWLNYV